MSLLTFETGDWESDTFQNKFIEEYYQAPSESNLLSKSNSANCESKGKEFSDIARSEVHNKDNHHSNRSSKTKRNKRKLTNNQTNVTEDHEQNRLLKKFKNEKINLLQNSNNSDAAVKFSKKKNKNDIKHIEQASKIKCKGKFPNKNLHEVSKISCSLNDKHNEACCEQQAKKKKKKKQKNNSSKGSPIESNVKFCNEKQSFDCNTHQISPFVEERDKYQSFSSQKSALLREKTLKNIQAAKFRLLNEKMYTETGSSAFKFFLEDKDSFYAYHQGYQMQVSKWPINPVDLIIKDIRQLPNSLAVADLGCGDAKIAQTFLKRQVHSFDLVALNDHVTCCNISKVPLGDGSMDVAVFCLSLMGTNLNDFVLEAHRILKPRGLLKIAEVESRFDDLSSFIKTIEAHGFVSVNKDVSHKMFVLLDFNKIKRGLKKSDLPKITLKPCLYKKR